MELRSVCLYTFLLLFWLTLFCACKQKSTANFPVAITDTIPIEIPLSTFKIPITYAVAELENLLNGKIKGKFFETTITPTKNEKDQVKIEMSKLARIQISSVNGQLVCKVPLRVKATIVNSKLNIITKGIKPVETDVELELMTPADLDQNWNLVTKFRLTNTRWIDPPIVKIAGIPFNLQEKIDNYLQENKHQLTNMLDEALQEEVSLEKPMAKIWLDIQKPMVVVKQSPSAYIRFICHSISGDIKLQGNNLLCFTTIKAQVVMLTETELDIPVIPLPRFKQVAQSGTISDAEVYVFVEFFHLKKELGAKLNGMELKGNNLSVTIKDVDVYASDSGLTVLAKTKGDIDASIAATVQPRFDSVTQSFEMENFQFQVVTDNVLAQVSDALLHDRVRDSVQTYLALGMDTLIKKIPGLIEHAISKGKTGETIGMDITDFKILSCRIEMGSRRLHFLVHTTLNATIALEHINTGKQVKIKPK